MSILINPKTSHFANDATHSANNSDRDSLTNGMVGAELTFRCSELNG